MQVIRFAWAALLLLSCGGSATQATPGSGAAGASGTATSCLPRGKPVKLAVSPYSAYYLTVSNGAVLWADTGPQSPPPKDGDPSQRSILKASTAGGSPELVAGAVHIGARFAASDSRVYWIDGGGPRVWSAPRDGSAPATVFGKDDGFPVTVAVDGGRVIWGDTNGALVSADEKDGLPSPLVMGAPNPFGLVAAGGALAWIAAGGPTFVGGAGKSVTTVNGLSTHVFSDGDALDAGFAYLGDRTTKTLFRVSLADGAVTALADIGAHRIALTRDCVYAGDGVGVAAIPKTGGAPQWVQGLDDVTEVATDGLSLFVLRPDGGSVANSVWKLDL